MKKNSGIVVKAMVLTLMLGALFALGKPAVTAAAKEPCPDIDVRVCWLDGGVYNYEFCKCEF